MVRIITLRLLESYYRHRWLYLLPMILMIAAASVYLVTAKPKYAARGVLYVQNQSLLESLTAINTSSDSSWWITPAQATSNDLNELMQTNAFIRAVVQFTPLEQGMDQGPEVVDQTIDAVRRSFVVYPIGENQVSINATFEDPEVAYQMVTAIIDVYVQWQINAQRSDSEAAQTFFADLINTYNIQLEEARSEMSAYLEQFPEPIRGERSQAEQMEIARIQSRIDSVAGRYANAMDKEEEARLAMAQIENNARQSYLLIDAPRLPGKPDVSLKELGLSLAIFVGIGVFLSAAAIVGAALLDRTFRLPVDVVHTLNLPVLAIVPDTHPTRNRWRLWSRRRNEGKPVWFRRMFIKRGKKVSDLERQVVERDGKVDEVVAW